MQINLFMKILKLLFVWLEIWGIVFLHHEGSPLDWCNMVFLSSTWKGGGSDLFPPNYFGSFLAITEIVRLLLLWYQRTNLSAITIPWICLDIFTLQGWEIFLGVWSILVFLLVYIYMLCLLVFQKCRKVHLYIHLYI